MRHFFAALWAAHSSEGCRERSAHHRQRPAARRKTNSGTQLRPSRRSCAEPVRSAKRRVTAEEPDWWAEVSALRRRYRTRVMGAVPGLTCLTLPAEPQRLDLLILTASSFVLACNGRKSSFGLLDGIFPLSPGMMC